MANILPQKTPNNYECNKCDFICSNKKDYNRHINTAKHKRLTMANLWLTEKTPDDYKCMNCNKTYKHKSSLSKHKKKCVIQGDNIIDQPKTMDIVIDKEEQINLNNVVEILINENKNLQNTILELVPKIKGDITNNTTNTNSHNTTTNQFNINMFLNEQCKNAMNLTDFIESLPITAETFDYTNQNGLTKSLTHMMVTGLNGMDVLERPIHCTDPHRKTMYVKENDIWEKDDNQESIIKSIDKLAVKQRSNISKWQEANIGWNRDDNLQTKFTNIVGKSLMLVERNEKEMNKIVKELSKSTYITENIKSNYN